MVRASRHRDAALEFLTSTGRFHSARQVFSELQRRGTGTGIASVYRALRLLTEAGEVDVLHLDNGVHLYRRCGPDRHYHLTCRHCGRTVEVYAVDVEAWARQVAAHHGYRQPNVVVQFLGTCADCAGLAATSSPSRRAAQAG